MTWFKTKNKKTSNSVAYKIKTALVKYQFSQATFLKHSDYAKEDLEAKRATKVQGLRMKVSNQEGLGTKSTWTWHI